MTSNKELISQILRYVYISLFGYGFVFIFLYIMVDLFKVNKSISFMIVYGISYLLLYSLQLKLLFKTEHNKTKLIKFCFSLIVFYILSNLLYNIFIFTEINYLISTILVIIILMPLRFIASKYFVYK